MVRKYTGTAVSEAFNTGGMMEEDKKRLNAKDWKTLQVLGSKWAHCSDGMNKNLERLLAAELVEKEEREFETVWRRKQESDD